MAQILISIALQFKNTNSMKKVYLLVLSVLCIHLVFAQEESNNALGAKEAKLAQITTERDALNKEIEALSGEIATLKPVKNWKYGGFAALNLNQASFVNWSTGGENSIAFTILGNLFANYRHNKLYWNNNLDGAWGMINTSKQWKKNEDRIELNSKAGYDIYKDKLSVAALANFRSQFTPSFDYEKAGTPLVSYFGAPAYLTLGIGLDYKPASWFSIYVSPATGKFTFVRKDPNIDETLYGLDAGKTVRTEFGAYLRAEIKKDLIKNLTVRTTVDLFNNYTDPNKGNRKNIDVNWQVWLDMKVTQYIAASIYTQLIYDQDTGIPIDNNKDGTTDYTAYSRTQFRELLGVGVSYKFSK